MGGIETFRHLKFYHFLTTEESIAKRIELAKFFDYVGEAHKEIMKAEPHWYLWMLGTDPVVQKQGIGVQKRANERNWIACTQRGVRTC